MYGQEICNFFDKLPCAKNFKGISAADRIPDLRQWEEAAVIVNTQVKVGEYGHWLALYYQNGALEFFDSFGRHFSAFPYISDYVKEFPDVVTNNIQFQSENSEVCALYCIFYNLWRYLKYDKSYILRRLLNLGKDRDQHLLHLYTKFNEVFDKLETTNEKILKCKICYDALMDLKDNYIKDNYDSRIKDVLCDVFVEVMYTKLSSSTNCLEWDNFLENVKY
ncbi:hypothetical protein TNCT_454921 [Trichonephila clavata]|uniref:Uncharacterized protein n=1 Tax=Trichonephila clavata TaxID=2740835 RepID=A0A8X6HNA6_TRICU|nr:hypothetical protein TNCT_454921 [Trichonephila clavata]